MRILVVEDVEMLSKLFMKALTADGHEVRTASSGEDAMVLAMAGDWLPELTLVDYSLPGMVGTQLIKSLTAWGLKTRFVGMSCSHTEAEEAFKAMGADFLRKPFRLTDFRALVRERRLTPRA
jgi:DNA-binding response OmpR family regulator